MDATLGLTEVPCGDGRRLWLGVSVDWTFGPDGADFHLPLFMWMLGVREDDEDEILLDRDEPFISVRRAAELAPEHLEEMLAYGKRLVDRTRRNIAILGFGPQHPYQDEIRRFVAEMSRARRAAAEVELTGSGVRIAAERATSA